MKIDIDLSAQGATTLSLSKLEEMLFKAWQEGKATGLIEANAKEARVPRVPRNMVSATKPTPVTIPENNKELLSKFFNPKNDNHIQVLERDLIAKQANEDGYREGYKLGHKDGKANQNPVFDARLHVDNSIYGYTYPSNLKTLSQEAHSAIVVTRTPERHTQTREKAVFVKITPIVEGK